MTNPMIEGVLDDSIAHHENGRLELAEAGYRTVLESDPRNPDALNLLGLLIQDRGDYRQSIELISRALDVDPEFPE